MFKSSVEIFRKDFKSELRTKFAFNSLLMFVVVTIIIIKFSLGEDKTDNEILSGLFWIVVFFSASSGLSRVFIKEEEKETSVALKLSTSHPEVLAGKFIFNFALSFLINAVIFVFFIMATGIVIKNFPGFVITFFLGNMGLVSASTIIAAIISKANSKGTLYPVLSFPVLLPLLLSLIEAGKLSTAGVETGRLYSEFLFLFSYTVVVTITSFILFKYIWED
ncbi:MAG: heme exporter protein CcmB [Ignavibacteria bacterium]|nr:heme exporter protein CcmB [Ignavibacteria bacterium]